MEYYKNGLAIRCEIEKWLLTDFNTRSTKKSIDVAIADMTEEDRVAILDVISKYDIATDRLFRNAAPMWFAREKQYYMLKLVRSMMHYIVAANSIYVGKNMSLVDYAKRRGFQNDAIACVHRLAEEIKAISLVFSIPLNKYTQLIDMLDREDDLLKGWRKSENKWGKKLIEELELDSELVDKAIATLETEYNNFDRSTCELTNTIDQMPEYSVNAASSMRTSPVDFLADLPEYSF